MYPRGSNNSERVPLFGGKISKILLESGPQPKNSISPASKGAKENRDKKDAKDWGSLFGSPSSNLRTRAELSAFSMRTPRDSSFETKESIRRSAVFGIRTILALTRRLSGSVPGTRVNVELREWH